MNVLHLTVLAAIGGTVGGVVSWVVSGALLNTPAGRRWTDRRVLARYSRPEPSDQDRGESQ